MKPCKSTSGPGTEPRRTRSAPPARSAPVPGTSPMLGGWATSNRRASGARSRPRGTPLPIGDWARTRPTSITPPRRRPGSTTSRCQCLRGMCSFSSQGRTSRCSPGSKGHPCPSHRPSSCTNHSQGTILSLLVGTLTTRGHLHSKALSWHHHCVYYCLLILYLLFSYSLSPSPLLIQCSLILGVQGEALLLANKTRMS